MTTSKKDKKEVLAAVAKRTAKLNSSEPEETTGPERMTGEDALETATPPADSPKLAVSKGDRSYAGPTTWLMNELYDAVNVPAIETFQGWERIALVVSKACERLEKDGWRKGKR